MMFKSSRILLMSNIHKKNQHPATSQMGDITMTTAEQLHQIADRKNNEDSMKAVHALQRIRSFTDAAAEQGKYEVFVPYVSIFEDYVMNIIETHEAFQNIRKAVFMKCKEEGFGIQTGMNNLGEGWLLTW